jgi:hypothetical protein
MRPLLVVVIGAIATIGVGACRKVGDGATAVRLPDGVISEAMVAHWMKALAPGHLVPDPSRYTACTQSGHEGAGADGGDRGGRCAKQLRALRQRAVSFLIGAYWLIGQADKEGDAVTNAEVQSGVGTRRSELDVTNRGYIEVLDAAHRTLADVELEVRSERAAAKLRELIDEQVQKVSASEIRRYYHRHLRSFQQSERRDFYIVEDLKRRDIALARLKELRHGRDIATFALRESMERTAHSLSDPSIVSAIFRSRPGELVGPIAVNRGRGPYYLIEVYRVHPARVETIAEVARAIKMRLERERKRQAIDAFFHAATKMWVAHTNCDPRYVVARCEQFVGPRTGTDGFGAASQVALSEQ